MLCVSTGRQIVPVVCLAFFDESINLSNAEGESSEDVNDGVNDDSREFFVLERSVCVD